MESFKNSIYLDTVKSYFVDIEWEKLGDKGQIEAIILYEMYKLQLDNGFDVQPPNYVKTFEEKKKRMKELENSSFFNSIYLETIKSYFTVDEWEQLGIYGQIEVIILYEIYKLQLDNGFDVSPPSYMKKSGRRLKKNKTNKDTSKITSTEINEEKSRRYTKRNLVKINYRYSTITKILNENKRKYKKKPFDFECTFCGKMFRKYGKLKTHVEKRCTIRRRSKNNEH